ncbi:MAG: hypothetical protein J0M34_00520 [Alphaproteobacteria bacterium]|nr:hypothetical protein [Alphaproteobacteria bacterium]
MQEPKETAPVAQEIAMDALAPAPAPVAEPVAAPTPTPAAVAEATPAPVAPAPSQPSAMPIENPPTLAPTLSAQEKEVMYGALRNKIKGSATTVGGGLGTLAGLVGGGIFALVTKSKIKGKANGMHWSLKTLLPAVAIGAIGAVVSRITWGKGEADKAITNLEQQISALPPEQQAAAYEEIRGHLGVNNNTPKTSVAADTAQIQPMQAMQSAQLGA